MKTLLIAVLLTFTAWPALARTKAETKGSVPVFDECVVLPIKTKGLVVLPKYTKRWRPRSVAVEVELSWRGQVLETKILGRKSNFDRFAIKSAQLTKFYRSDTMSKPCPVLLIYNFPHDALSK